MVIAHAGTKQVVAAFGGPIVWALHFGVLYAANAVTCARGAALPFGLSLTQAAALVATPIAALLIAGLWCLGEAGWREAPTDPDGRSTAELMRFLSRWLGAFSLLSILWTTVPVLLLEPCN